MFFRIFASVVFFVLCIPHVVGAQASDTFTVSQLYGDDTELPTTPDPFSVTPISPSQIDIVWGASTDNSAVIAYQLFRDGTQIATTTALTYSDIGLAASTSYSYYVQALDLFQNVSLPSATISTSTYALPEVIEPVSVVQQTVLPPRLVELAIDAGVTGAWMRFRTQQPVTYTFRYGIDSNLTTGFVQSDVFKTTHETVLTDLQPKTTYQYELYATDRFGRTKLLDSGSFTTLSEYSVQVVPNVTAFDAYVIDRDVSLSWTNPAIPEFRYVRVVRNHYHYPMNPTDGFVLYEGPASAFYDTNALGTYDTQYYTVFTYGVDGRVSSGAVARARFVADGSVTTGYDDGGYVVETASSTAGTGETEYTEPWTISLGDIIVIQDGAAVPLQGGSYSVVPGVPFMVQVRNQEALPVGYGVYAHFAYPLPAMRQVQYLFRPGAEGVGVLETTAQFEAEGQYDVLIKVTDASSGVIATLPFAISVSSGTDGQARSFISEGMTQITLMYVLVGGVIGLLIILLLRTLLLLLFGLFGRDRDEEDQRRG